MTHVIPFSEKFQISKKKEEIIKKLIMCFHKEGVIRKKDICFSC